MGNILKLPANSRAYLVEVLLESLDFEEDFTINNEWKKEIKRRCREIDEDKVNPKLLQRHLKQPNFMKNSKKGLERDLLKH
ncbi:MAG: addiction module protein [Candidatus Jettenia sp.]|nr:addiction module protein [Candidatus Jettenia sp.]